MSNDTRKTIADAEWASVERDVEVTLREMAGEGIPFATNAENAATLRAYHDALKARHEREMAAYREVAALANRDRANALAERDEERRLRILAAKHAEGVQAGYQRDLDALRTDAVALLGALAEEDRLPVCDWCNRLATREVQGQHEHDLCDVCSPGHCDYAKSTDTVYDLPHAAVLRRLLAHLPPEEP